MNAMADGLWYCDLEFRGLPRIIATGVVHNADGVALIDPGPSSCLPALRRSLAARGATAGDIHPESGVKTSPERLLLKSG